MGIDATTCRWRYSATERMTDGGCCNVGAFPPQEAVVDGHIGSYYAMNSHGDAGTGAGQAHVLRARAHFPAALLRTRNRTPMKCSARIFPRGEIFST